MRSAIRNTELIREDEAVLPVVSREVQYSFSVYEALRITDGHVVHLDDHLKRLAASCGDIGLVHHFSDEDIEKSLDKLIAADGISNATARIFVVGGPSPLLFITYSDLLTYPDSYYTDGVKATLYQGERFMPQAKTSNLLMQYIALEEARREGAFEALLVDRNGEVLEGTRSNFYAIKGSRLYTAPDDKVLSGITRISVLKAAAELGLEEYRYDDDERADHAPHDVREAAQLEQVRRRADESDYHEAADKLHRACADEQKKYAVYEKRYYEYIEEILPAQVEESQRRTPLASIF